MKVRDNILKIILVMNKTFKIQQLNGRSLKNGVHS